MIFDFEMIDSCYKLLDSRILAIRKTLNRPLSLSEKVLYSHIYPQNQIKPFKRGVDYVDFMPDRVAMQDATAQMAILQFMMSGKDTTAVRASVHCDHLILAQFREFGAEVFANACGPCIGQWARKSSDNKRVNMKNFASGKQLTVTLNHSDGTKEKFPVDHSYNESQIEWFKAGSALNIIRKSNKKNVI